MKYNGNNLEEVLECHKRWLKCGLYEGTEEASKADFTGADLRFADLKGAFLRGSEFSYANLSCAILTTADLSYANLFAAQLNDASLVWTNLSNANLCCASLNGADMGLAILHNAILTHADLRKTKQCPKIPMAYPSEGSFIAWKKCFADEKEVIVKLKIPDDAERSSATCSKCRASKAEVLEIQTLDGEKLTNVTAHSRWDPKFIYIPGTIVSPEKRFCKDRFELCGSGIHFFLDRQEAVDYTG